MLKKSLSFSLLLFLIVFSLNCSKDDSPEPADTPGLYFPPKSGETWETVSLDELGWKRDNLQPLLDFLDENGTKAFIILKDGKIAVEWYSSDFNSGTFHTWNSAAKTLAAFTIGIAQKEGYLDINESSQLYLGAQWSDMTDAQEKAITIRNHLTMTTGLDYTVAQPFCTDPEDLIYKNGPGTFWYYHNAPYQLTHAIITGATGQNFPDYFYEKIRDKIGMKGRWVSSGCLELYFSDARSMARFGLLNLNKGKWDNEVILDDSDYFNDMVSTSQNLNKAYGYLWWLNGKDSYRLPSSEAQYTGNLIPSAPKDMYAGLGKNDQKLYVIPSINLVVVRLGDSAYGEAFAASGFDEDLWIKMNLLIN